MQRTSVWVRVVLGWLPVAVLLITLILAMHQPTTVRSAAFVGVRLMLLAAVLGVAVARVCSRLPWPHPFRASFIGIHVLLSFAYATAWLAMNLAYEIVLHRAFVLDIGPGIAAYLVMGMWLYILIAGTTYASRESARAAAAGEHAAQAQLATLRAQMQPHFLFNALHVVVQLIPIAPDRATRAAEQVSDLLRTAVDENRDRVPFGDETTFVRQYLGLQNLRYGERLVSHWDVSPDVMTLLVPSFSIQTLVENAVRHGAEPSMSPTTITVTARADDTSLVVTVSDTGTGPTGGWEHRGTGLRRLRERLSVLHGKRATIRCAADVPSGFVATMTLPREEDAA